ncbi:MAG: hypothetical protein RLZZ08_32 [Pseudomonadota bacterium]|jgi:hypothetical protein
MIDKPRADAEESENAEQDDEAAQSQTVAGQALHGESRDPSPLDSVKHSNDSGLMDDSTQDLVDHMRDMEQSGRIDMGAYRGEPNHDDDEDKYGEANKEDDLPAGGS